MRFCIFEIVRCGSVRFLLFENRTVRCGAVRFHFFKIIRRGAVQFSLFQNHTVRCGADYIFQEPYGAVRCGAVRLSVE